MYDPLEQLIRQAGGVWAADGSMLPMLKAFKPWLCVLPSLLTGGLWACLRAGDLKGLRLLLEADTLDSLRQSTERVAALQKQVGC